MPGGERLWRTDDGDLVEEGHPDAALLAYGEDDEISDDDKGNVRKAAKKAAAAPADKKAPKAADKQSPAPKNK